ncbi:Aste57867_9296 [Aphanomyces stellatus]|uniref:Aste57867_9296 protein n=1 Tax=Aphanomyces stellatus TaxID=120398 RepID=A0A485KMI6_9STRA|nr:hypothetical protein As57867_009260 [Aphanomyces stellatus]VFT86178.1 Aste57867_9296 [Aphanomyces stellatus]
MLLHVVRRRAHARATASVSSEPTTQTMLGQLHASALAMYESKCRAQLTPDDDVPTLEDLGHGHVLLDLQVDDESVIEMNKRLIRERNALAHEKAQWQAQLQEQHQNLQEVLAATRLLKQKMQLQDTSTPRIDNDDRINRSSVADESIDDPEAIKEPEPTNPPTPHTDNDERDDANYVAASAVVANDDDDDEMAFPDDFVCPL